MLRKQITCFCNWVSRSWVVLPAQDTGRKWWDQEQKGRQQQPQTQGTVRKQNRDCCQNKCRALRETIPRLENKEGREGTSNGRPSWELFVMGQVAPARLCPYFQVAHCRLALLSYLWGGCLQTLNPEPLESKKHDEVLPKWVGKKKVHLPENNSNFVHLHMWSNFGAGMRILRSIYVAKGPWGLIKAQRCVRESNIWEYSWACFLPGWFARVYGTLTCFLNLTFQI